MKVDYYGEQIWERSHYECVGDYLGPIYEIGGIIEDEDGGFVLAGSRRPHDYGPSDVYLLKIDENGSKVWEQTCGGPYIDEASSIVRCPEGFIVVGRRQVNGSNYDAYVLKINRGGEVIWERTYGGPLYDSANCVVNAYYDIVIGGETTSFVNGMDLYAVKIDGEGNKLWERSYGGRYLESATSITTHLGGSVVLAGRTRSFGKGAYDVFIIKLDGDGELVWNNTYGGVKSDTARAIIRTPDWGFFVVGDTNSYRTGDHDLLFLRLDRDGDEVWLKTYGGP